MTASPTALLALASELEAADGPSRELDARILVALGILEPNTKSSVTEVKSFKRGRYVVWLRPAWSIEERPKPHEVEPITASVDACLALLSDVLPGWRAELWTASPAWPLCSARLQPPGSSYASMPPSVAAPTLPRAILAALLRAVAARGG